MKLYPDVARQRWGYVLADVGILLWIVLCIYGGGLVYDNVMTLTDTGRIAISSGHEVHAVLGQVQQLVAAIPLGIGPILHDSLNPLYRIPANLVAAGQNEIASVERLAALLDVIVVVIALLAGLLVYVPWRVRRVRAFGNMERMLQRSAANPAGALMQVLAARALYTLPFDQLLRYSPDPIAEWRAGAYENLARAAVAADGVALERYLRPDGAAAVSPERDRLSAPRDRN